jgi:polar amino acid transport system ATP-binding protein
MSNPKEMVRVEQLSKSFGSNQVLKSVDLAVAQGEVVVMIGASGSGKTTLLRCINLLETPDSGRISVDGRPMGVHEPDGRFRMFPESEIDRRRAEIGMVFQRFNLFSHLKVIENVTLGPIVAKGMGKEEARELAMTQLRKVGLESKADSYPSRLSGGQQQRVAIARALALKPKLMLFDEPTSALDPELVGEVLETMRQLASEGMTMVIVTHEMQFASEVADTVCFLADGALLESAPPAQLFTNPSHERTRTFLKRTLSRTSFSNSLSTTTS